MPFQSRRRSLGRKPLLLAAATAVGAASLIAPTSASALKPVVGAIDATTGFPSYIEDDAGTRLDLCLDSPFCLANKADLTAPDGEAFWWNSEATMATSGGSALMVLAVEAAYGGETAGTESAFSRVRFRIDVAKPGDYTVTYPYGTPRTFHVTTAGRRAINVTSDVGCVSAGTFDPCTQERFGFVAQGPFTNYLRWDPDALPATPGGFLGDANTPHKVVGGPRNVFRVDGPDIGGPGVNFVQTDQMTVQGRLASTPDAPPPTDQTPPAAPTGVTATAVSSTQINLSWNAVTGAAGYRVYRDGAPLPLAAQQTGTTYSDTGLPPSSTHTYQVASVDAAQNERLSAQVSATTQAAAGTPAAVVSPINLRFGTVPVRATRTLATTVRNAGTAPLTFSSIALNAGATRYAIRQTGARPCTPGIAVDPGQNCTVTVAYTPTTRNVRSLATLTISSNAGRDAVAVSGRAGR